MDLKWQTRPWWFGFLDQWGRGIQQDLTITPFFTPVYWRQWKCTTMYLSFKKKKGYYYNHFKKHSYTPIVLFSFAPPCTSEGANNFVLQTWSQTTVKGVVIPEQHHLLHCVRQSWLASSGMYKIAYVLSLDSAWETCSSIGSWPQLLYRIRPTVGCVLLSATAGLLWQI